MSPDAVRPGSVRSADAVNEQIRALVRGARNRSWTRAEQALYALLRDEWVAAARDELVKAA